MGEPEEKSLVSPGYKIEDLRNYIRGSKWSSKCGFLEETTDITELCHKFLSLLRKPLMLEDAGELITAISMVTLIDKTKVSWFWSVEARMRLMRHTIYLINGFNGEDLPGVTLVIWKGLKLDNSSSLQNILEISRNLANSTTSGRAMAVILMWMTISNIAQIEPKLREFSELTNILESYTTEKFNIDAHLDFILIQCVATLVSIITDKQNEDITNTDLCQYFNYSTQNMDEFKDWIEAFVNKNGKFSLKMNSKFTLAMIEIAAIISLS